MTDDAARALALAAAVDAQRDRILDVTRFVNRHPELAHEEFDCARHTAGRCTWPRAKSSSCPARAKPSRSP